MTIAALISTCGDCDGSGAWFDMPAEKRRLPPGMMGSSECTTCGGWGLVPTEVGRPFFDMVLAMRQTRKWR